MKTLNIIICLFIILFSACNECRYKDCAPDDFISIQIENEDETVYTYNIDFYFFNNENQKIEAEIKRARHKKNLFYAFLDYRQEPVDESYYLEIGDQSSKIEITKKDLNTTCCGKLLKFESVRQDDEEISLPIVVDVENIN